MFIVIDGVILTFVVIGVAIFFSSASKVSWPLYLSLGIFVLAWFVSLFWSVWKPSILLIPIAGVLGSFCAAYDIIVLGTDKPDERYFSIIEYSTIIWAVIMSVRAIKDSFQPDDVFIIPMLFIGCSTLLCEKSTRQSHKKKFLICGTLAILLSVIAIIFHPAIAGVGINVDSLNQSIRFNSWVTVFLAMFFLGNYGKFGLLQDKTIHKKAYSAFFALYMVSVFMRFPQLSPFLKTLPIGEKLPSIALIGFVGFPPGLGILLKRNRKIEQIPNQ